MTDAADALDAPDDVGAVVVGVDIGSSRTKAGAYDRGGALVGLHAVPTPTVRSPEGIDFPVLAMLDAARAAVAGLGLAPGSVAGLAVAAMGEVGTLLVDDQLADLHFPAWYDERGADVVAELEAAFGRERLAGLTGGHVRATSSLAKLAWLRRSRRLPPGTFLGVAGALAWDLTGVVMQEASLAATSGAFDPVGRHHLPDVWSAAGLADVAAAPVVTPGTGALAGTASSRALGLPDGALVVVAGHDHPVAAVGTGARPGEVVDSMGTGEPVLAVLGSAVLPTPAEVAELVAGGLTVESWPATGDPIVIMEGLRPGLAMETFLQVTGADREQLDADAPAPGVVQAVDRALSRKLEDGSGVVAGPAGDAWAALLDHYACLAADGERTVRSITAADGVTVLTGGGLRSGRWLRAKVELGASVPVVSTAAETVTRGSAAIVGAALGWWPDAAGMPGVDRLTTVRTA